MKYPGNWQMDFSESAITLAPGNSKEIEVTTLEQATITMNISVPYDIEYAGKEFEIILQAGGLQCSEAWKRGDVDKAVAHNRSCLLKERDILLERGHRTPDTLRFVDVSEE